MTVKELINKLERFDPDKKVKIWDDFLDCSLDIDVEEDFVSVDIKTIYNEED